MFSRGKLTEQESELRNRAALVGQVSNLIINFDTSVDSLLLLLEMLIERKSWTHFLTKTDEEVIYPDTPEGFRTFISTPRIEGLGTSVEEMEGRLQKLDRVLQQLRDMLASA